MAGQRQPIQLVQAKGRKHLTKEEIEERTSGEIIAPCDKIEPPKFLTKEQRKNFNRIKKELMRIDLIANVDCEALGRLIVAQDQYAVVTEQIKITPLTKQVPTFEERTDESGKKETIQTGMKNVVNTEYERLMRMQDTLIKQCRQMAGDFGMTVSSRCRLIVPKAAEQKPENKFAKYAAM